MRTALKWTLLVASLSATSYLSHRFWPSEAAATLARGGDADAGAAAPGSTPAWSRQGFRDGEGCELIGEPPACL
jgi:hypothetical protein